jgi:hypothetical protein
VIELVPVANPMGLGQLLQGSHQGVSRWAARISTVISLS